MRSYIDRRRNGNPIKKLETKETLATIYYLYTILKDVDNESLMNSTEIIKLISELASRLKKTEKLESILSYYISKYEAEKILKVKKSKEDSLEDNDEVEEYDEDEIKFPYYECDHYIRRHCDFNDEDIKQINYYRLLCCEDSGSIAKLIVLTFYIDDYESAIANDNFTVPGKFKKAALDTSSLDFLKKEVDLSEIECRYLLARYRKATISGLDYIMAEHAPLAKELYSSLADCEPRQIEEVLRTDQKLIQYGFLNEDRELNQAIIDCISNQDFNLFFTDLIKPCDISDAYDMDTFSVPEEKRNVMSQLLNSTNPVSILLYGKPGSGKTEYSKALIHACGKKAIIFKNEAETLKTGEVLARLNCLLSLNRQDTVLIVDEADSLLKTKDISMMGMVFPSRSKGIINKMLENSKNKAIWIVNYTDPIDDSTRRRFTLSCKFEAMGPTMLQDIANRKLEGANLNENTQHQILNMLGAYQVTGASVDNVVKAITSMEQKNDEELIKNVEIVLKENSLLLNGNSKMRETVTSAYDSSVLNTTMPAEKILRMVTNAQKFAAKNLDTGCSNNGTNGIRMLFYGLSGTGKTEFARYISEQLGKKILLKRASDILNKYVGGTEENIKDAFEEAAANDQILLFDEADTFFSDRNSASHSWERTQVNEFLTQMEEFPGILICTTNLRKIMDEALLRRFHITVEFNALTEEGISKLLKKYFGSYSFTEEQIASLCKYNSVTPGDFGRLSSRIRFMDEEDISSQMIIDELCKNQEEKDGGAYSSNRKIGFAC